MRLVIALGALSAAFGLGMAHAGDHLSGFPFVVIGGLAAVVFTLLKEDWI